MQIAIIAKNHKDAIKRRDNHLISAQQKFSESNTVNCTCSTKCNTSIVPIR